MNKQINKIFKKQNWSIIGTIGFIFAIFLFGTGFTFNKTNSPMISLINWSSPITTNEKTTELKVEFYHHTTFINTGDEPTNNLDIIEPIPPQTDFKIDSVKTTIGFTGAVIIEYSSNFEVNIPTKAHWTYRPISQNGGADVGYDRQVKAIRLRIVDGTLSNLSPNNQGSIGFITRNY